MSALQVAEAPIKAVKATLKAVPPIERAHGWPRGWFPVLILGLLALGMVGHLGLQTLIQQQGFELGALQAQSEHLKAQEANLQAALDQQSSPQQLHVAAANLGMVPDTSATTLKLPTGEVFGVNSPVKGNEVPIIAAVPSLPQPEPEQPIVTPETPVVATPPAEAPAETPAEAPAEAPAETPVAVDSPAADTPTGEQP